MVKLEAGQMTKESGEVATFLSAYPEATQETAIALRLLIFAVLTDPTEALDRPARVIGYGFGTGYKDMICTIIPSKAGVKLGIARGARLPDPDRLLRGSGKVHRHVQFDTVAGVRAPAVKALLKRALAAWKAGSDS
jgi:hypothetical protein